MDELDEFGNTVLTLRKDVEEEQQQPETLPSHLRMVVIANQSFATHVLPDRGALTIGRSTACDIVIEDKSISRRHAILALGERLTIEDLGSANGTQVRGQKLSFGQPMNIAVGELVGLGETNIILQRAAPARAHRTLSASELTERLVQECARAVRSGRAFALLHIRPEQRAQANLVKDTLAQSLRDTDLLGKPSPNEYAALLMDTPPNSADAAMQRLDKKLRDVGLSCQLSIACCPRDGTTAETLNARLRPAVADDKVARVRVEQGRDIIIVDRQMHSLYRMIEQIAPSQLSVLLLGETGVGKEVLARVVHRASSRASGPFVELNCAALPEALLESELFGHEKGAFTHATSTKPGLIESADGGTLFLDEIGDMPLTTQSKLLRVLEDSQLRRVGSLKARAVDIRIVAATNIDLEQRITAGTFRRDLLFRINGMTLVIPPLRERTAEIEPLARAFISARNTAGPLPTLAPETLELMKRYNWPGNIRELKYMVERAVLLCNGPVLLPEHLPEKVLAVNHPPSQRDDTGPVTIVPDGDEERRIVEALDRAGGNQTLAARLLGVSRRTLVNRLNELDHIERPRKDKKSKKPTL